RNAVFTHDGSGRRDNVFHRQRLGEGTELGLSPFNCGVSRPTGLRRVVHYACNVTIEATPHEESANLSADRDDACMWLCNQFDLLAKEGNPSRVPRTAVDVRLDDGHCTF